MKCGITVFLLVFLWFPPWIFGYPLTPDAKMTPGELCTEASSDFFEYRYAEQIPYCKRNVSSGTKRAIYLKYVVSSNEQRHYTIDHLIPLSLGGSNTKANLWPEHREVKALRPNLEMELYIALRDGELNQEEALDAVLEAKFHPREVYRPITEGRSACRPLVRANQGGIGQQRIP